MSDSSKQEELTNLRNEHHRTVLRLRELRKQIEQLEKSLSCTQPSVIDDTSVGKFRSSSEEIKTSTNEKCLICQQPMILNNNTTVQLIQCKHRFHRACVDSWIKMASECPACIN